MVAAILLMKLMQLFLFFIITCFLDCKILFFFFLSCSAGRTIYSRSPPVRHHSRSTIMNEW